MLSHVIETFCGGSPAQAVSALLGGSRVKIDREEIDRLQRLIDEFETGKREG